MTYNIVSQEHVGSKWHVFQLAMATDRLNSRHSIPHLLIQHYYTTMLCQGQGGSKWQVTEDC